jgi:uncharacterized membrane protein
MLTLPDKDSAKTTSFLKRDYLVIVAIGVVACLPFYFYGLPAQTDLDHHYRTALGFYESILSGNYYPSWHPSTNGGYGDVSVRFYPPVLYFMLSAFMLITRDWFLAFLLTLTSLTIASALGMYLWARCFTSNYYALVAGLLFVFSPFHVNELYYTGMYGQYTAASFLPFAFAFVERIIQGGRNSNVALLGLSFGVFVLCNVPLAVLGSISIALYALIRIVQSFNIASVYRIVAGGLLAVALSCFYWLPVLRELGWKSPSGIDQGVQFDYRGNFVFGPSLNDTNVFLPLLALATIAMAMPATILLFRKDRRAIAPVVIAVLGFFLSTPVSRPIWDRLPILQETQFPWRWQTTTSAFVALLAALGFSKMHSMWRSRFRPICLALTGLVLIALSFTIFQLMRGANLSNWVSFNQTVELLKGSKTNPDFLPIWAKGQLHKMNSEVESPLRAVSVLEWVPERKVFSIEAGQETDVRLKTYYYPYWVAVANTQRLVTMPADDGALMVRVPDEKATISVTFTEPLSSYIAGSVSTLALLVIVLLVLNQPPALRLR